MPQKLIVIGGGEHARVLVDAARSRPEDWTVVGFVDSRPCPETATRCDVRQLAGDEEALSHRGEAWFVLGIGRIGSATLRRQIATRFTEGGARWARLVHRTAWVSKAATVGEGAVVLAGAIVNVGAQLGAHSLVNTASVVEHDVRIGDFAVVAPGSVIGGGAEIQDDCYLGLGCRVRDHVSVGRGTIVGMGAVVIGSLPANIEARGFPAREWRKEHDAAGA